MNYNFIKDNIKSLFNGTRVDEASLELLLTGRENSFILNHNIKAISSILNFLNSSDNIFILNGFMGSGKTYVADFISNFIDENVLVFKNSYQEAINPDDILLSLFKDFSIFHNEKKIVLPKVETSVFSEKINTFIKYCNVPMLFIFDSFEINMRSKDTQKDILDFINYLSHFEKIKIIICSRTFKQSDLISPIGSTSHTLKPLEKEDVFSLLDENNLGGSNYEKEELYKITRGHYLLLELSILIMQILGLSLTLFSNEYKKSTKNFLEFLISKILGTTSDKFIKLLLFLTAIRHGVSIDFLIMQDIGTIEDVEFLFQKNVISEKFGKYYLKDYLKAEFIKSINIESKIKVHEFIVDLYEAELPLKPFERALFLSRQTMRQEIAYHQNKIETLKEDLKKAGKTKVSETKDFNYLSYSRTSGYDEKLEKRKKLQERYTESIRKRNRKKPHLSIEDSMLLNTIKQEDILSKNLIDLSNITHNEILNLEKNNIKEETSIPNSIDDYIEIAENYEKAYNYSSAILYYKKALTYKSDINYSKKEDLVYLKLASCYKKIQDTDEATRLYEKVYNLYLLKSPNRANDVLLIVAHMYSEIYKFDKAKEFYKRILYSPSGVTSQMVIRVYLDLSEIEDNSLDTEAAIKYVQKATTEAEKISDIKLISECYFKYALLLDDSNNIDLAVKYYLRCVQCSNNPELNTYMSSAYSNLAEIATVNNNTTAAKMYYELSIEADKKQNNTEGLYHSYLKLSTLYKKDNPEKSYELLLKALTAAKRFDDINYTITVYSEIGDYYQNIADKKSALKSYILAKRLIPQAGGEELHSQINAKINKIKITIGETEFNRLIEDIKKKR